jgi:hypothetical protein
MPKNRWILATGDVEEENHDSKKNRIIPAYSSLLFGLIVGFLSLPPTNRSTFSGHSF